MNIDWHKLFQSFRWAFHGLKDAIPKEQNLRIELFLFSVGIILGILLQISTIEWLFLLNAGFSVLGCELFNTAIERLTDLQSNKHKMYLAKQAKDISASAVFVLCIYGTIVGIVIFIPKIYTILLG